MKWRSLEESTCANDVRPLREIFAERKEPIAKYVPAETQAVHERTISELKAQQVSRRAPQPGSKIAAFTLPDHNGNAVSSDELLSRGAVVLIFFRGRWCPFCVGQLEAMNQVLPQIRGAGASLVALSPQTVKQSFFMADQHRLGFPLLNDEHCSLARQLGLVYRVPEEQQQLYRRTMVNLPFVNGDESWDLTIPATFVIDREGTILHAWAEENYMNRPEPAEIVDVLERLNAKS
jgi:peroxiredoxin